MARDATPLLELGRKAKATENRSPVPQRMPFSQMSQPEDILDYESARR
jgi:hypothetical protein